jgi:protein SCO1/2
MKALILPFLFLFFSCNSTPTKLPILGDKTPIQKMVNGKMVVDTLYKTIPPFRYLDQDSIYFSNANTRGKIYVADFFFTSCPTICPIMQKNLSHLVDAFKADSGIYFLSYSIDPIHDTPKRLKRYSAQLGQSHAHWYFLTGNRDSTYSLAEKGYYVTAKSDTTAPGGFVHSGAFILVDKKGRIRGTYDGTVDEDVNHLNQDLITLKNEKD